VYDNTGRSEDNQMEAREDIKTERQEEEITRRAAEAIRTGRAVFMDPVTEAAARDLLRREGVLNDT